MIGWGATTQITHRFFDVKSNWHFIISICCNQVGANGPLMCAASEGGSFVKVPLPAGRHRPSPVGIKNTYGSFTCSFRIGRRSPMCLKQNADLLLALFEGAGRSCRCLVELYFFKKSDRLGRPASSKGKVPSKSVCNGTSPYRTFCWNCGAVNGILWGCRFTRDSKSGTFWRCRLLAIRGLVTPVTK